MEAGSPQETEGSQAFPGALKGVGRCVSISPFPESKVPSTRCVISAPFTPGEDDVLSKLYIS